MTSFFQKVYIIAEAGVNHNGSLDLAKKMVDVAVKAGADAIKFQSFVAEGLVRKNAPKAEYQVSTTDDNETQFKMLKKMELNVANHYELLEYCQRNKIQFLSTPFDIGSVDLLTRLNLPIIKVGSGEITNAPLLLKIAQTGKPIILSTGMSTIGEIEMALSVLAYGYIDRAGIPNSIEQFKAAFCSIEGQDVLREKVVLLHCTTEYPAQFKDVNLQAMTTLKETFRLSVGFSDHTPGIAISIAAVALGANVIEKHFTLDRSLPGPDHQASLEPEELRILVRSIREVEAAIGTGVKMPMPTELANLKVARKSLVAARNIKTGEVLTKENLGIKRPDDGIPPIYYWRLLGKVAQRDYQEDESIIWSDFC